MSARNFADRTHYVVAIVEQETGRTVKTYAACNSLLAAERLHNGVLRNLNTDRYYVETRHEVT